MSPPPQPAPLRATPRRAPPPRPTPPAPPTQTPTPSNTERAQALISQIDDPWARGDWPSVIDLLTQARTLDPSNTSAADKLYVAYFNYGQSLLAQGKKDEAGQQFQNALAVKPDG